MRKILLFFVLIVSCLRLSSQDLHYSQFFNSPLNISPGLTGVFNGDTRIAANYRSQWTSVPADYLTFTGAVDFKINPYSGKRGNFNVGLLFDYDRAGDLGLQRINGDLSLSYSYRIDNKNIITPGIMLGIYSRGIDFSKVKSGNQWDGREYDPTIPGETLPNESYAHLNTGLGVNYRWQSSYRTHIDFGVALHHLNASDQSFANSPSYDTPLAKRLSLYAMTSFKVVDKVDVLVNAIYQKQNPHKELLLNAQGKLYFNKSGDRDIALILGVGLRGADAWYPMIALQYKNIYAGFSYDRNFSDFTIGTDKRGGPELAITYRISKVPPVKFKPCPIY